MVKKMLAEATVDRGRIQDDLEYGSEIIDFDYALSYLLQSRRSIKLFDSDVAVSDKSIADIISSAAYAPSAFNLQPWRVIQINSDSVRARLSDLAWRQPQISTASRLLLIAYDNYAWDRTSAYQQFSSSELRNKIYSSVSSVYKKNPKLARDEAIRASSLYAMNVLLAAEAKGFQSCALTGFDFDGVAELMNMPADWECCMLIAIGKSSDDNVFREQYRQEKDAYAMTDVDLLRGQSLADESRINGELL